MGGLPREVPAPAGSVPSEVFRIVREVLADSTLHLTPDMGPSDIEDWTSLSHVHLVVALEQRFGLQLGLAEIQEARTVGAFITLIEDRLGPGA